MIEKMMELQRDFAEMYRTTGLVAVSDDYIQVDAAFMREHFPVIRVRKLRGNTRELTAKHSGMEFIAVEFHR